MLHPFTWPKKARGYFQEREEKKDGRRNNNNTKKNIILILTRINHRRKCSFAIKMQECVAVATGAASTIHQALQGNEQ